MAVCLLSNLGRKVAPMLLSHSHRFIYTKTLKTAGTAVEIYFEDACVTPGSNVVRGHQIEETVTSAGVIGYRGPDRSGRKWYNHMPAREIRELVGHGVWDAYYKFCVVRNPFDKLVSLWWFTVNSRQQYSHSKSEFSKIKSDFSEWCLSHASVAVDRDEYVIDGQLAMDFIIKYESLLEGLESVCRQISYPFRPEHLGRYKGDVRAIGQSFCEYYDPHTIAAVEAAFGWELECFGYRTPSETVMSS
jgi:hypothetical protein